MQGSTPHDGHRDRLSVILYLITDFKILQHVDTLGHSQDTLCPEITLAPYYHKETIVNTTTYNAGSHVHRIILYAYA